MGDNVGLVDGAALGLDVGIFVGDAEGIVDGLSWRERKKWVNVVSLKLIQGTFREISGIINFLTLQWG